MQCSIRLIALATCFLLAGCSEAKHPSTGQKKKAVPSTSECAVSDLWSSDPGAYRISAYPATDSASSATAMAMGHKTVYGLISVVPGNSKPPKTIAEYMKEQGAPIGIVTSVPFNHATPAAFVAHVKSRGNYAEIAGQVFDRAKPDVVIGGGHPAGSSGRYFSHSAWMRLLENAGGAYTEYDVVGREKCRRNSEIFDCSPKKQLAEIAKNGRGKLAAVLGGRVPCNKCGKGGSYTEGTLTLPTYVLDPDLSSASYNSTLERNETGKSPRLKDAVQAALAVLERRAQSSKSKGSFLMVEGGDVDWAGHSNDFAWMLASMHEFEEAVKTSVDYVDSSKHFNWDNTLLIVTADHACSFLRIDKEGLKEYYRQKKSPSQKWVDGPGPTLNGVFDDGEWSYGSGDESLIFFGSTDHTNELVTIIARGKGALALFTGLEESRPCGAKKRSGLIDNTQIFFGMKRAIDQLGIENIILMIGDGMHKAHEEAYSIIRYGEEGGLVWDKWSLDGGPDVYSGKVTTWDISTYDWYACNKGRPSYKPDSCEAHLGYDESMTPEDPSSIGGTSRRAQSYFLTMPKRKYR